LTELQQQLLGILAIGHDISMRGEGISLRDALHRSAYRSLRGRFNAEDLVPLVRENPAFIDRWIAYSEDKRTPGGWWLRLDPPSIGQVEDPGNTLLFRTREDAVAEYVIRELDFWSTVRD